MEEKVENILDIIGKGGHYITLGAAGLSAIGSINSYEKLNKLEKEIKQIPYHEEIARHNEVSEDLNTVITANDLFNEETRKHYYKLAKERDSLNSLEGFNKAKDKYKANLEAQEKSEINSTFLSVLAVIFGGLGISELYNQYRRRKNKNEK